MSCGTVREAEALARHGIRSILIANEIAGPEKIGRFLELSRVCETIVAIDNPRVVDALAAASRNHDVPLSVLVDVDVHLGRCGVRPGEEAVTLARHAIESGLRFRGLMGYEGRLQQATEAEREAVCRHAMDGLRESRRLLEANNIPVEIVSVGGSSSHAFSSCHTGVTEIQVGSYLLMDTDYRWLLPEFELALSVLTTVISRRGDEQVVVDTGLKEISAERGLPVFKRPAGLRLRKLNAEHGIADIVDKASAANVGDLVEIWPHYEDGTVNLHRRMYGIRNGRVEEVMELDG